MKIVLGMIPSDFFAPFASGNPLQMEMVELVGDLKMLDCTKLRKEIK